MDVAHKHHQKITVTKYGKLIVRMVGISSKTRGSLFGFLKDSVIVKGDIVSPLKESWNAKKSGR